MVAVDLLGCLSFNIVIHILTGKWGGGGIKGLFQVVTTRIPAFGDQILNGLSS